MVVGLREYIERLQNLEKTIGDASMLVFDRILTDNQAYRLGGSKFEVIHSEISDIIQHLPD